MERGQRGGAAGTPFMAVATSFASHPSGKQIVNKHWTPHSFSLYTTLTVLVSLYFNLHRVSLSFPFTHNCAVLAGPTWPGLPARTLPLLQPLGGAAVPGPAPLALLRLVTPSTPGPQPVPAVSERILLKGMSRPTSLWSFLRGRTAWNEINLARIKVLWKHVPNL